MKGNYFPLLMKHQVVMLHAEIVFSYKQNSLGFDRVTMARKVRFKCFSSCAGVINVELSFFC